MASNNRALAISVTVLAMLLVSVGVMVKIRIDQKADSTKAAATGTTTANGTVPAGVGGDDPFGGGGPRPVHGAEVIRGTLVQTVTAQAQAAASRVIILQSETQGRIASIPVGENDGVASGTIVMAIDTLEAGLEFAAAQASLRQAKTSYEQQIITDYRITDPAIRAQRDSAAQIQSGLVGAQIRFEQAQLAYARTKLRTPIEGRIADIKVIAGQRVGAGTEIMKVVDLDPIKVEVQVLEAQINQLGRGRRARVTFTALPGEEFVGRIETTNPIVDPTWRTARVTVLVPNPRGRILPGMYATVRLDAVEYPDRIMVPRSAILQRSGRDLVLVYKAEPESAHGVADWRYVTVGLMNEEFVEIVPNPETKMVEPGEIVLVNGHYTVGHDMDIRLVNKPAAAPPPAGGGPK
jgi:RND family efflux transporter MFP subunit